MGYYTRVFCKNETIPPLKKLQEFMSKISPSYKLQGTNDENVDWENLELYYKEGRLPILIELNKIDEEGGLGSEEVNEFLEEIGSPWFSLKKMKVIRHLKQTRYIVCNQLPTSDIDNDGYNANGEFMKFLVDNHQGLAQADGEGFYEDNEVILKLE